MCLSSFLDMDDKTLFAMITGWVIVLTMFTGSTLEQSMLDPFPSATDVITKGLNSCPHINFCTANRPVLYNVSCCQQCSCSPDCADKANCCPDIVDVLNLQPNKTSRENRMRCVPATIVKKSLYKPNYGYNMVSTCPDGKRCSEQTTSYPQLRDIVVVHSEPDKHIYRNRKCAICNGAENIIEWDVAIQGCTIDNSWWTQGKSFQQKMYDICLLTFVPPSKDLFTFHECLLTDQVDVCNTTGLWNVYSENLVKACEHPLLGFSAVFNGREYRNIYCALCNNPIELNVPTECKNQKFLPSLGNLLYIRMDSLVRTFPEKGLCTETEVYDPNQNICHALHCPPFHSSATGKCIPFPINTSDIQTDFTIILKYAQIESSHAKDNTQLLGYLIFKPFENRTRTIVTFLGIDEFCRVNHHVIRRYAPNENANFVLFETLSVESSSTCTYDRISSMLDDLFYSNRTITIAFTSKVLTLTVKPFNRMKVPGSFYIAGDYKHIQELYLYVPEPIMNSSPYTLSANVELERPYKCPFIILNDTHLCRLYKYLGHSDNCSKDAFQYIIKSIDITAENGEYRVCFKDYVNVFSEATVSEESVYQYLKDLVKKEDRIVSLLLTITSSVCIFVMSLIYQNRLKNFSRSKLIFFQGSYMFMLAQLLFFFSVGITNTSFLNTGFGIVLHYTVLATVFAFASLGYVTYQTLKEKGCETRKNVYCVFACSIYVPVVCIVASIIGSFLSGKPLGYGNASNVCRVAAKNSCITFLICPVYVLAGIYIATFFYFRRREIPYLDDAQIMHKEAYQFASLYSMIHLIVQGTVLVVGHIVFYFSISEVSFEILFSGQGLICFLIVSFMDHNHLFSI